MALLGRISCAIIKGVLMALSFRPKAGMAFSRVLRVARCWDILGDRREGPKMGWRRSMVVL